MCRDGKILRHDAVVSLLQSPKQNSHIRMLWDYVPGSRTNVLEADFGEGFKCRQETIATWSMSQW